MVITSRVPDGADRHGRQLAPATGRLKSAALRYNDTDLMITMGGLRG